MSKEKLIKNTVRTKSETGKERISPFLPLTFAALLSELAWLRGT
jgi:hypothetical protein